MFKEDEIKSLIELKIIKDHDLGEQTGGSGHMSLVSFQINSYKSHQAADGLFEIIYEYTIIVETEFTYYPDNPPYESHHNETIFIDSEKNIITPD